MLRLHPGLKPSITNRNPLGGGESGGFPVAYVQFDRLEQTVTSQRATAWLSRSSVLLPT
jgi:hypothetical protein